MLREGRRSMRHEREWWMNRILCECAIGRKLKRDVGQSLSVTVVGCYRSLYYTAAASVDMIWYDEVK